MAGASAEEVEKLREGARTLEAVVFEMKNTMGAMQGVIEKQMEELKELKMKKDEEMEDKPKKEETNVLRRGQRRDLLIDKKGFHTLSHFTGKIDKYEDWAFTVRTYLDTEEGFDELLEWVEKLTSSPTEKDIEDFQKEKLSVESMKTMNDQLYVFMCMNLKDEALTIAKNAKQ